MSERRRHQRYLLEQSCFVTDAASVGTIVDIGMGGLSCMCLEEGVCYKDSKKNVIDIFCETAAPLAQGLTVKILDSSVVSSDFYVGLNCRKCRVQFEHLEHEQKTHLEEIILSRAIHPTKESGSTVSS